MVVVFEMVRIVLEAALRKVEKNSQNIGHYDVLKNLFRILHKKAHSSRGV